MSALWFYRIVRWTFAAIFISIGLISTDGYSAIIFGGIFLITSFLKPTACIGDNCSTKNKN